MYIDDKFGDYVNYSRPGYITIGRCSKCGGEVEVPNVWGGVIPPTPTCHRCGATKREEKQTPWGLPVIDMQ